MANSDYEKRGSGDFTPVAELVNGVSYFDDTFLLKNQIGFDDEPLEVGMAALVGEEIIRVTEVGEDYVKVARGCADTIPAVHGANTLVWFYEETLGSDGREYAAGETIAVKVTPNTTSDVYPLEHAPPRELTMNWRFSRPYPPGQMRNNGEPWFEPQLLSADSPDFVLTWVHRNRVLQADQLVDHHEASIPPEPGMTYWFAVFKDTSGIPTRFEGGLTGETFTYTWAQAIVDLDFPADPEGTEREGLIAFGSERDDLLSWQSYEIRFTLNNQGMFLRAAQLSQMVAQPPADGEGYDEPPAGMFAASMSQLVAQPPGDGPGGGYDAPLSGIFVSQLVFTTGQETALVSPMARTLFEAPYTFSLRREGADPLTARVVTVAARPSDRLTDVRHMYSRIRPEPNSAALPFEYRGEGGFTPWLTIDQSLTPLQRTASIRTTSLFDGIPLSSVQPGQMALLNAEIVRVEQVTAGTVTFDRGCVDTTPANHHAGSRIWFFEAGCLVDTTPWPRPPVPRPAPADSLVHVEYKALPAVIGTQPPLNAVGTDRVALDERKWRPFPPGNVTVDGREWFRGAFADPDKAITVRWVHRNRLTQGAAVVDHLAPSIAPEPGTTYRISITVRVSSRGSTQPTNVLIREAWVEGDRFDYTYEMAYADGFRVARLLNFCGTVSVQMRLDAYRDGLDNWQGYGFMLRLPAPVCPPGRRPGGGQSGGAWPPGRGNGSTGPAPGTGGGDSPAAGDPLNNSGGGGSNTGSGPRPPDQPPPDWPDPVETAPGGGGEPPEGSGQYWDHSWDIFWAADTDDDPGDDEGQD